MRCAAVRAGTLLTTALITAAVADMGTEFAENCGWLGGSLRDAQQQAVAPALLIGLAVGAALAAYVAFARIAPHDPLLRAMSGRRVRTMDLAAALAGSALCAIAMEGYETRFGGLSPFDPRSVLCSHAPALLAAFLLVAPLARGLVGAALRLAGHVGERAGSAIVQFLHRLSRARACPQAAQLCALTLHVPRLQPATAPGARGLRAPPRTALRSYFVT